MVRRFSTDFAIFSMVIDYILVMLSLRLAVFLRPKIGNVISFAVPINEPPIIDGYIYPLFAIVWVAILLIFSVYDPRRNFRVYEELYNIVGASILATSVLAGYLYLTFREISRVLFLSFAFISFINLVSIRIFYHLFMLNHREHKNPTRRILILGAGPVGIDTSEQIRNNKLNTMEFVGFLDDDPNKLNKNMVLGTVGQTVELCLHEGITDVIFALPSRAWNRISSLVKELHELPLRVWVIPDYYTLAVNRASIEELAGIPLIDLRAPALNDYQRMIKRFFDLVICFIVLLFTFPLFGVIALCIKLDSSGPIIFRQIRVGENGRLFTLFKFRTMKENAEQMHRVIESIDAQGRICQDKRKTDPRITRVGHFLRRFSLDELPQLFNIFRGDMSLIGPRPELPYLVEQYQPWQRQRLSVPQGLTGWWQVNGRSDKPMHQNSEYDLYYVKNYSCWLDIKILLKTLLVVIQGKGSY